ncbi:hypothetical protein CV770_22540 [Bradyrhizobium sp. AC87j1]|uniref:hypothetical protein n=1 Tax=Bradyrhizobium sp. AC87j1 TaxID=2055894 RepID=UPI000CEBB41F|nr:hypothetical protein [Bradyrhizobium sp. AC87j1]PPQ17146.1 hypothetical protein CV770_22540 [Bradyrhizobium sp. AC87j1]
MRKARLPQQTNADVTIRQLTPSPLKVNALDSSYFGYWSKEEILSFLKQLLDGEHIGLAAYAAIGRAACTRLADLALEAEMGQGAICILLRKEIAARGGTGMLRARVANAIPNIDCSLRSRIRFASRNQAMLADMIEDAVVDIFDSKLNAKLIYLLLLHRKQVEQLEAIAA